MPSGILQLLVTGAQDKILISNPQMNHFKQVYLKHANFSIFNYELPITSQYDFNSLVNFEIPKNGDLLRKLHIKVELPSISIEYNNPLNVEIENIKKKNAYKSIDLSIYNYNLYNLNTFKDIMEYQLDITTKVTNSELFWYDSNTKVETYNVVIPKLDLNEFIATSDKEYYYEINPDPRIFSNTSVNFNFPLISTPNIITDYQTFYNKILLYSSRNSPLSATFNIIENLLIKNYQTTLLTSDNLKNILIKNLKDNIFIDEEFAAIDSLYKYIDSIRFIRPIALYDNLQINNILHSADSDLIGYPEYDQTYFKTTDLKQILITASVSNTVLNTVSTRLIYVLTTDVTGNQIKFNNQTYGLYNIIKLDYITTSILNSLYNQLLITGYQFINYFDYLNNPENIQIKITPFTSSYTFEFDDFSQLFNINNITKQLNGYYKIELPIFTFDISLINKYIYFYYNVLADSASLVPFCILQISSYYIANGIIYIFANPINVVGLNMTTNNIYLVDNQYLLQTNNINSDAFDLKKINMANVDIDSYNLYNNFISIPDNVNFNLDGTIETETAQKTLFKNKFSTYISNNLNNDYSIIYNILKSMFKNPIQFISSQTYVKNLYFKVILNNDGINGFSISSLGTSTFAEQDAFGNSIMIKYLTSILAETFDGLIISDNYYLSLIQNYVNNYSAIYQKTWNNLNDAVQNAPYMRQFLKTINFIENSPLYIRFKLDTGTINTIMNLTSTITDVYVFDSKFNYVTILKLSSKNCVVFNNRNYIYIYISDLTPSNVIFPSMVKSGNRLEYVSGGVTYSSTVVEITYVDTIYATNLNSFLSGTTLLNSSNTIHGNYIYTDFLLNLYDYLDLTYQIYLSNKYKISDISNVITIIDTNILYKYVSVGFNNFLTTINNRLKVLINQQTVDTSPYLTFLTDYEYLTNTIKTNAYFYDNIINDFYNFNMINGYYFMNSYSNISVQVSNIQQTHTSFSNFINSVIDNDTFITNTGPGILLKTYLYYNAGTQLEYQYNTITNSFLKLSTVGIKDGSFSFANIGLLTANLILNSSNIYDGANIANYLDSIDTIYYNNKDNQYDMNPHLYYAYLNLGYIENLLSLNEYGNINLSIKDYTNFKYSDIDNVIVKVLDFYRGQSFSPALNGVITMNSTTDFYSNVLLNSSIESSLLELKGDSNSIILNDLVYYSTYRFITTGVSLALINICNVYVSDVKKLISYFNDNLDNINYLRFISENDTTITGTSLYNKLNVSSYTQMDALNINDYQLEYYENNNVYQAINNYRTNYIYNTVLQGVDTDVQNYLDYTVSIYNTFEIGSSLKKISDQTTLLYPTADLYTLVGKTKIFGNINVSGLDDIKNYLIGLKNTYSSNYNIYVNNANLLNIQDDIELNTINSTIKTINTKSGQYIPSLSSMDQFDEHKRKNFGFTIDSKADYIYNVNGSITNLMTTQSNIANIELFNKAILDTYTYQNFSKTYEFQLRLIQSYFNTDVYNLNDSDIAYLKPFYALENTDLYYYNYIYIAQINKLYNNEIPSNVVSFISKNNKLDNNLNQMYFNVQRNMSNAEYYLETLKILDNNTMTQIDLNYMKNYLKDNVIYINYVLNSENGTRKYEYKPQFSLVDYGTITFFSNNVDTLYIPIINSYVYNKIDLTVLTTSDLVKVFYYNFLYLLHDLFLLDGNMRVSYSKISGINSTYYNSTSFKDIYKKLVTEYFYLILKEKQITEESDINTITFSTIYNNINNKTYDKLLEYLLYSNFNTDNTYDLGNVITDYKIQSIQKNHEYDENFAIIYGIKTSINDQNFEHLIDITNYNNKYNQYYDLNYNITTSNLTLLQQTYLANVGITNDYIFYQNMVIPKLDYNQIIQSNIFNANVYTSTYQIDTSNGNIVINMNDIKYIKTKIQNYLLNELAVSNTITNTSYLNGNSSIQSIVIDNLEYNGNLITQIDLDLKTKTFAIQKSIANVAFIPTEIQSLNAWFDSSDRASVTKDLSGVIPVATNGDLVAKWTNKASTGESYKFEQPLSNLRPSWNINGGIKFNGFSYFNTILNLNTTSTIFLVTETSLRGGYNMYFDNGNVFSPNIIQGPTIWSDGPYGNYLYDDYTFNLELDYGLKQMGLNIFSLERVDGKYINGYNNGYTSFINNSGNIYGITGNVSMSVLPGYLDQNQTLAESMSGNIYEILIFNSILSNDQKTNINIYLGNKWKNKYKINLGNKAEYFTFPFDYLPKLYDYTISNSNVQISLNHYWDKNFSNIADQIYYEYNNIYKNNNYSISANLDISNISQYLYMTDLMTSLGAINIKNVFDYDLTITSSDMTINNSNIYISNNVMNNYNNYISEIDEYKTNLVIKDSFELILNPLKFDTNYTRYKLMNNMANIENNSNIYYQKLPTLIQKTSVVSANTTERIYNFNKLVDIIFSASLNGSIFYNKLDLANTYIGNVHIPTIPYKTEYNLETYFYQTQQQQNSNIVLLNDVIDINNQISNLEDQKIKILNNTNLKISEVNNDIINYNKTNLEIATISKRPPNALVSWIEKLGIYFTDFYEFYIGGELIERVEDDFINCYLDLYSSSEMRKALRKMIGQVPQLILKKTSIGKYTLYLDIPFYFNRYKKMNGNAVPIIALLYNKLNVKFKIKALENLLNFDPYTKITKKGKMKINLMCDYILLDHVERKKFAESKHEYIIEQIQYSNYVSSSLSSTNQIKLNFKNPTKTMIWFAQLKEKITKKQYYNYTQDDYYYDMNKYIESTEVSNKYLDYLSEKLKYLIESLEKRDPTKKIFNRSMILKMPFENHNSTLRANLRYAVQPTSSTLISQSNLKVNGHTRFLTSADETQLIRPYTYYYKSLLNGINIYNFNIDTQTTQPTGSINFSFLNDINLLIDFNKIIDQELTVKTMTISFNMLRIMSGYGGLAFDVI